LSSALWYLWNLLNEQLYLLPCLFLLAGAVYSVRKRTLASRNLYPILMAVGTYVIFTLLRHKDPRYTLPMFPALAVLATSWLEYVTAKARAALATVFVAYSAAAFLVISFGTSLLPSSIAVDVPSTSFIPNHVNVFAQHGYIIGAPTDENWHQADAFRIMARLPHSERVFAYRGPYTLWFTDHGLNYYSLRYDVTWVHRKGARTRFLLERSREQAKPLGYVRLHRWPLPDGGTLALFEQR
jgi:hypothetical protein